MRALLALFAVGCLGRAAGVDAQQVAYVRDPGAGPIGQRLAAVLRSPHRLIAPSSEAALLSRDSAYGTPVVVLARDAVIEGQIRGDVFVVGGDAFVHPGATVDGRVIAIGGGAYGSRLAIVRDGLESNRDFTFEVTPTSTGYALDYRVLRGPPSPVVSLPGVYGLRLPMYDRSDGLSIPFAPLVSLDTGRFELEPTITYRSHIGAVDPSLLGRAELSTWTHARLFVGRATFTNDDWIWSDLVNSASVFALGNDTRNYFRGERIEGTLHRRWLGTTVDLEPFIGARIERDWAIGPDSFAVIGGPWSMFGRHSREEMLRPNPPVPRGTLQSALFGLRWGWEAQQFRVTVNLQNEAARFATRDARFLQTVIDAEVRFPTFKAQMFWLSLHALHTFGDSAPPQRWAYLGGSGTLPTLELLSLGGDHLLFVESNYYIPVERFTFRVLGSPSLTLRHAIGSAGVAGLPGLEQNLSIRAALSFARVEFAVDPARRRSKLTLGLSVTR